ncbi:MAG TPA: cobalamin-dependent protein [Clostridia bacterium]|nr:cobalamin-dependent protein [Clostridia bacterium]HRX41866.1 cobalamin-dependent protein [Clostridia bacterium]
MELENIVRLYEGFLLSADRLNAARILDDANKTSGFPGVEKIVSSALESIGDKWESGEVSLAQIYLSGSITETLVDSYFNQSLSQRKSQPRIGICVLLDHHQLGKRIVLSILRSNGYNVTDLGSGLLAEDVVKAAIDNSIDVLLISTLMLSSALKVKDIVMDLKSAKPGIKIIAGGAPFRLNKELWKHVGTDANGGNATEAVNLIEGLMG